MKTIDNYISNEKISSLDEYITEKLKIGKNTSKNTNNIELDIDSNDGVFYDYFSNDDINELEDFAQTLEICPILISNKFKSRLHKNIIALYFSIDQKNRIAIEHLSGDKESYRVYLITNNSMLTNRKFNMNFNDVLKKIPNFLEEYNFFEKI